MNAQMIATLLVLKYGISKSAGLLVARMMWSGKSFSAAMFLVTGQSY